MSENSLDAMRHSVAHIMALAVRELYPTTQFGIGPSIENGFYQDVTGVKITEADLPKIERRMREIIAEKLPITESEVTVAEAEKIFANQPFKLELIKEHADKKLTLYTIGDYVDLCKGPHVATTGDVGVFKLTKLAGAYWRGDEKREQMTRIYGVAFETEAELAEYETRLEEAKKRDHRKLGKELDLFCFSPLVGAGLPLFTPRGTALRDALANYSLGLRGAEGFSKVWTPHITKVDLYKKSGHFDKFGEELFMVHSQINGEEFAMKPMNCPHHAQIFASKPRSYKEMPVRYMEATTDYRDEKPGELGGLSRVRSLTQDDSHVFCRQSQIKAEIATLVAIIQKLYTTVGMSKLRARLSYRDDSDKYLGDKSLWEMSQAQIREAAIENKLDYFEAEGEAAFYGPKIDFMAEDAIGREHQVATVQLDFVQPARFELEYTNEEGKPEQPVMIHHATLGSIERFLSVFIEHTAGRFPFWCAPEQVRVLTIGDVAEFTAKVRAFLEGVVLNEPLKYNELRFSIDESKDNLGKKLKRAEELKIPVIILIGPKDAEAGQVTVRTTGGETKVALDALAQHLREQ